MTEPQTATIEAVEAAVTEPLSAWERVKLARHAGRPHTLDYIHELFTGFVELHGDRAFGDDMAMIGGIGTTWPATSGCRGRRATARPAA